MKWYALNIDKLGEIELVDNTGNAVRDSTKYYSVNFGNTEKYLSELKKSSFVSEKYLNNMRGYFNKCQQYFIERPQNDEPPAGFDFDLVLWSQEYEEDLANLDKMKVDVLDIDGETAKLKLTFFTGSFLMIYLSKEKKHWLVDEIESRWAN